MIDCQAIDAVNAENYSAEKASNIYVQAQPLYSDGNNSFVLNDGIKLTYMNANVKCTGDKCFYIV